MKPIERNERAILIRLGQEPGKIRTLLEAARTAATAADGKSRPWAIWADAAMSPFLKDKRGIVTLDCVRG